MLAHPHHDPSHPRKVTGIRNTFFAGLLVVVPLSLTLFLTLWVFDVLTRATPEVLSRIPHPLIQDLLDNRFFSLTVRLVGLLAIVAGIFSVGLVARNVIGRKLLDLMEAMVLRLPMIRTVYSTLQQLGYAILRGGGTGMFRQVALVEYPRKGVYVIGFITAAAPEECNRLAGETMLSVFIPTTPNPTSGFLLLLPQGEIKVLAMSVLEGMRLVISGGAVSSDLLPPLNPPAAPESKTPTP